MNLAYGLRAGGIIKTKSPRLNVSAKVAWAPAGRSVTLIGLGILENGKTENPHPTTSCSAGNQT